MQEGLNPDWSEQLGAVVERAGEVFVDLLEKRAAEGGLKIARLCEEDKRTLEQMFQEAVYGNVVPEAMAIVAVLAYRQTGDHRLLHSVAPAFLDRVQQRAAPSESGCGSKADGLPKLAAKALSAGGAKDPAATPLLNDLVSTPAPEALRATFDGVALSLLGE